MRKNVLIIFIGLLLLVSCKLTQDKESYKITSVVYITDWGEKAVDRKGIQLYAIDSLGRTKPQKIKVPTNSQGRFIIYEYCMSKKSNNIYQKIIALSVNTIIVKIAFFVFFSF